MRVYVDDDDMYGVPDNVVAKRFDYEVKVSVDDELKELINSKEFQEKLLSNKVMGMIFDDEGLPPKEFVTLWNVSHYLKSIELFEDFAIIQIKLIDGSVSSNNARALIEHSDIKTRLIPVIFDGVLKRFDFLFTPR